MVSRVRSYLLLNSPLQYTRYICSMKVGERCPHLRLARHSHLDCRATPTTAMGCASSTLEGAGPWEDDHTASWTPLTMHLSWTREAKEWLTGDDAKDRDVLTRLQHDSASAQLGFSTTKSA